MHKRVTKEFKVAPQTNTDWVFERMMAEFIRDGFENGFKNAKLSAQSDMTKLGDECALLNFMTINSANDAKSLIRIVAGFTSMSENVQQYYKNPEKAMHDYTN